MRLKWEKSLSRVEEEGGGGDIVIVGDDVAVELGSVAVVVDGDVESNE